MSRCPSESLFGLPNNRDWIVALKLLSYVPFQLRLRQSKDWIMLSNADKGKVMHLVYSKKKLKCEMNGRNLEEITYERDLGIIVHNDLK